MVDTLSLLERAANPTTSNSIPDSAQVVTALLEREKEANKQKSNYTLNDLVGCWKLRFITGTKKTRKRAGIVLGSGKYIPSLVKIQIAYENDGQTASNIGRVTNTVKLAFLTLSLTGPVEFIPQKSILAFDFTAIKITALGLQLYNGYIKDGAAKEAEFKDKPLKERAFFRYFLIQENAIAARGRGGGLALWAREK